MDDAVKSSAPIRVAALCSSFADAVAVRAYQVRFPFSFNSRGLLVWRIRQSGVVHRHDLCDSLSHSRAAGLVVGVAASPGYRGIHSKSWIRDTIRGLLSN